MDLSYHQDVVYLGGSSDSTITNTSRGVIRACVFNRKLTSIGAYVFEKDDMKDVTALRRLPKSDVLAVGGYKHLYIMQYTKKVFSPLFVFNNIHTSKLPSSQTIITVFRLH